MKLFSFIDFFAADNRCFANSFIEQIKKLEFVNNAQLANRKNICGMQIFAVVKGAMNTFIRLRTLNWKQ